MSPLALTLSIALAGAAGTLCRFGIGLLFHGPPSNTTTAAAAAATVTFPWAIATVNVVGSFGFGFFYALTNSFGMLPREFSMILLIGFFGAFTTFSTFSYDTLRLLGDSRYILASINAFGQLALGLLAVALGMVLGTGLARLLGATATATGAAT